MDELDELDKTICQKRGEKPRFIWSVMDNAEKGIFIEFEDKHEASAWMEEKDRNAMRWVENYGVHIVRRERWTQYTRDIAAAWKLVEEMGSVYTGRVIIEILPNGHYTIFYWHHGVSREANGHTAPVAICRAYLQWAESQ